MKIRINDKVYDADYAVTHLSEVFEETRPRHQVPLLKYPPRGAWMYIPGESEIEQLKKYCYSKDSQGVHGNQTCPQCLKGRLVMTNEGSNMGTALVLRCKWGKNNCDYENDITDYGMW